MSIKIIIPGNPIARIRPRFARRGGYVATYNPQKDSDDEFRECVKQQINGLVPLEGPLDVCISFRMLRPRSDYKTGKNSHLLKKMAPTEHTKKPDIDNMVKLVFDNLNKLVWKDDSQVVRVVAEKYYAVNQEPQTYIKISSLNGFLE